MRLALSGTQEIAAAADVVWRHLLDHDLVAAAAPGVESVEVIDAQRFRAVAALGVGNMSLRFRLHVELYDIEPPLRLRISVKGAAPGSAMRADAGASIVAMGPLVSRLEWTVASDAHGTVAGVGARMLQGTARKITETFWRTFAERISSAAAIPAPESAVASEPSPAPEPTSDAEPSAVPEPEQTPAPESVSPPSGQSPI